MSDPRNVAHDKKVAREKNHQGAEARIAAGPPTQPGKKAGKKPVSAEPAPPAEASPVRDVAPVENSKREAPPELEGSLVVLSQLKEMAFHSKAHQEQLSQLMLTVEEKLKQKELAITTGEVYSAHAEFHTRLTSLVDAYESECAKLQG